MRSKKTEGESLSKIKLFSLPQSAALPAADSGGPFCRFATSPHTVGSHPRQREPDRSAYNISAFNVIF